MIVHEFKTVLDLIEEEPFVSRVYRYRWLWMSNTPYAVYVGNEDPDIYTTPVRDIAILELLYANGHWTARGKELLARHEEESV